MEFGHCSIDQWGLKLVRDLAHNLKDDELIIVVPFTCPLQFSGDPNFF